MVMVKPALAYLDVIAAAAAHGRRAARRVSRQRRVRDDQGAAAERLDRPRRRGPRAPHGASSGPAPTSSSRTSPGGSPRACATAGSRTDGLGMTIAFCDPITCAGRRLHADGVHGRRRAVERHDVRAVHAGHPRRRQLLDPGLQGGRRRAVRRRAGRGAVRSSTSRAPRYIDLVQSYGAVILGHAHPAVTAAVARRGRSTARRTARRRRAR